VKGISVAVRCARGLGVALGLGIEVKLEVVSDAESG